MLPCCDRTACDQCIVELVDTRNRPFRFACSFCNALAKIELILDENDRPVECKLKPDVDASRALDKNLEDLNRYLVDKFEYGLKTLEERFDCKENYLQKRKKYLSEEIHIQVETIKNHLDELEELMKEELDSSCRNALINMNKFEKSNRHCLIDMIGELENLKLNEASYYKEGEGLSRQMQKQSVNKCLLNLDELNKLNKNLSEMINEIKFTPNIDMPSASVIGTLKAIKEINLLEQFKTIKTQTFINKIQSIPDSSQRMPITPRYVCIPDKFNLIFTDSQTKQIIQLTLDTGDFVRSTNLNGVLKNPDGICLQPKTGHLYVSDSELNVVFKLDSGFNVLKKFGQRDLKWPRGLFYDSDDTDTPNRLYVCDYSNSRVAIYNEHEQLRDCLSIFLNKNQTNIKINEIEDEIKFCPFNVNVTKTFIYVTDDWTGGNCIRMFDKKTHALIRNIGDVNAWNPLSIIVDDNGNVFTVARLYYETGNSHLFCFNRDGELLYKTNLNINSELIGDVIIDNFTDRTKSRMICCGDKKLHYINF